MNKWINVFTGFKKTVLRELFFGRNYFGFYLFKFECFFLILDLINAIDWKKIDSLSQASRIWLSDQNLLNFVFVFLYKGEIWLVFWISYLGYLLTQLILHLPLPLSFDQTRCLSMDGNKFENNDFSQNQK